MTNLAGGLDGKNMLCVTEKSAWLISCHEGHESYNVAPILGVEIESGARWLAGDNRGELLDILTPGTHFQLPTGELALEPLQMWTMGASTVLNIEGNLVVMVFVTMRA